MPPRSAVDGAREGRRGWGRERIFLLCPKQKFLVEPTRRHHSHAWGEHIDGRLTRASLCRQFDAPWRAQKGWDSPGGIERVGPFRLLVIDLMGLCNAGATLPKHNKKTTNANFKSKRYGLTWGLNWPTAGSCLSALGHGLNVIDVILWSTDVWKALHVPFAAAAQTFLALFICFECGELKWSK